MLAGLAACPEPPVLEGNPSVERDLIKSEDAMLPNAETARGISRQDQGDRYESKGTFE